MSDTQRHVHYTKVPFFSKMFYVGVGAAVYWLAFSGGCGKVKSFTSQAMENRPVQNMYYSIAGNSIDDSVQPSQNPNVKAK